MKYGVYSALLFRMAHFYPIILALYFIIAQFDYGIKSDPSAPSLSFNEWLFVLCGNVSLLE